MPGFDRTGPESKGPRTGRELGKCNPVPEDSPEEIGFGRGIGKGFGGGRNQGGRRFRNRGRGLGRNR